MRRGAWGLVLLLVGCGEAAMPTFDPSDAAIMDSGVPMDSAMPPVVLGPIQYPADRTQSPITADMVTSLQAIAARGARTDNVFSKFGDSITVNTNFFACFSGGAVDLGAASTLQASLDHFDGGNAGGANPFSRVTLSATVGDKASDAVAGNDVAKELAATNPRFGVVMYGTNDIPQKNIESFENSLLTIVDTITDGGTIPVLSTVPPLSRTADEVTWTKRLNGVIRGIAQGRRIPLVDLYREMTPLPSQGIGGDNIHPNVYPGGACKLTTDGLVYGFNMRNRVTLEGLDRARQAVLAGSSFDPVAPRLAGKGTAAEPYLITGLPFSHLSTTEGGERLLSSYGGCAAAQNEGGPERYYAIDVTADTGVRIFVLDRSAVDTDVHLLAATPTADACRARNDREVGQVLTPGRWYITVDTFVGGDGAEKTGEYLLLVLPE